MRPTCSGPVSRAGTSPVLGSVGFEQTEGEGVEGRGRDRGERAVETIGDPAAEIGGPAPREAEHQDLLGMDPLTDEVERPPHQELGLAGAGPCDHELRAFGVGDDLVPTVGVDSDSGAGGMGRIYRSGVTQRDGRLGAVRRVFPQAPVAAGSASANAGHMSWNEHQSHRRPGRGGKLS